MRNVIPKPPPPHKTILKVLKLKSIKIASIIIKKFKNHRISPRIHDLFSRLN